MMEATASESGGERLDLALRGKVAVVTGRPGGLGDRLCSELKAAGAIVAEFRDVGASELTPAVAANRAYVATCDLADRESLAAAVADVTRELGDISILVNNCSPSTATPLVQTSSEMFDAIFRTNNAAVFNAVQAVTPGMIKRGRGRIVNVSAEHTGSVVGAAFHAATAGMIGLSKSLARELAPHGVTVNAVTSDGSRPASASADDPAQAVLFLCSDLASYVTGETIRTGLASPTAA